MATISKPVITEFTGEFTPGKGRKPDAVSMMLDEALQTSATTGKPQMWTGAGSGNPKYTSMRQRLTNRAEKLGYKVEAQSVNDDKDLAFKATPAPTETAEEPEAPAATPKKSAKAAA